jgi:lathosterol oxidase
MFNPITFTTSQWFFAPLLIFGRYALVSSLLYSVFYLWKRKAWLNRKIQSKFPQNRDYRREIGYSAITSIVFALVSWLSLGTSFRQYTQFYTDIHQHSILYLVLSIPLTLLIHDTYFYWIHRLLHVPWWYKKFHRLHHTSINPSPWAAYAFHPVEAVLEAGIVPLLLLIMPMHPISFFSFITLMLWFNVYGHLGYEVFPRAVYTHPIGRWLNSGVYHNQHHERFQGNYSLYFVFWDRWMGTLRSDSAEKIEQVHRQIEQEA